MQVVLIVTEMSCQYFVLLHRLFSGYNFAFSFFSVMVVCAVDFRLWVREKVNDAVLLQECRQSALSLT